MKKRDKQPWILPSFTCNKAVCQGVCQVVKNAVHLQVKYAQNCYTCYCFTPCHCIVS